MCDCIECDRAVSYQLAMETFEVERCVRGHHVFHTVWIPTIRERLDCARKTNTECSGSLCCGTVCARTQSLVTSLTLSLAACSSFPEREESPISLSLGSIQLSFLKYWYSIIEYRVYIRTYRCACAYPSGRLGWGLILVEFKLAFFHTPPNRQIKKPHQIFPLCGIINCLFMHNLCELRQSLSENAIAFSI